MKRLAIALAVLASPAFAQMGGMKDADMKGMDMKAGTEGAKASSHKATGVVTKVDSGKGKVTIKHEPVQTMNWSSMTMAFRVEDKAMLDKLAKGRKVDFEFVQRGKDYIITSVK